MKALLLLVPSVAFAVDGPAITRSAIREVRKAHWSFAPYLDAHHGVRYIAYTDEREKGELLCGAALEARLRKVGKDLERRMSFDTDGEDWSCQNRPTPSCELSGDHGTPTVRLDFILGPAQSLVLDTITELQMAGMSGTRWFERMDPFVKKQAEALREQVCP